MRRRARRAAAPSLSRGPWDLRLLQPAVVVAAAAARLQQRLRLRSVAVDNSYPYTQ
jgi:hypothetical protein